MRQSPAYLDAHHDSLLLNKFREQNSLLRLLVQGFMEEDDPAYAVGNGGIDRKEEVTEEAAVLFVILHVYLLKALSHSTCGMEQGGMKHGGTKGMGTLSDSGGGSTLQGPLNTNNWVRGEWGGGAQCDTLLGGAEFPAMPPGV